MRRAMCLLVAAGLLTSACTGAQPAATGPDTAARLTVAIPQDVGPLNIFVKHEEWISELVYDKLVAPSPFVDDPRPWLAREVRMIDGSTWEVAVRDDVTWHDGERLTAEDVVFTFSYAKAAPTGRWTHHITEVPEIASTTLVDADTVRFSCAYPCPELGSVTLADIPILPEHVWSRVAPDTVKQVTTLPVGTGPYRLSEYGPATGYRFTAYPEYFGGAPRVRELVMPVIEDPSATFTALRSGEIDVAARRVPPELLDEFTSSNAVDVMTTSPLAHVELRMNYTKPVFADPRVRSALSLALDKRELLEVVALGRGRPATQGRLHPDSPWADPAAATPTDPAQAAGVLDAAGYRDSDRNGIRENPDGSPIALTLEVNGAEPTHLRAAELVAEHLGAIGIGVTVTPRDAGGLSAAESRMTFDLVVRPGVPHGVADPTQYLQGLISGFSWDLEKLPYPELAQRVNTWKRADTVDDRRKAIFELQRFFNAVPTVIALYYPDEHWAFRAGSYSGFAEARTYGILHKWSLIPRDRAVGANALVTS